MNSVPRLDRATTLASLDPKRTALLQTCRQMLRDRVTAAWIYGSFWTDHFSPSSDLDIAVVGLIGDRWELTASLSEALHRDVDLLELDHSDPIIGFQVLAHGLSILDEHKAVARLEGEVLAMYLDWKVARRPIEEAHARLAVDPANTTATRP